MSASLTYLGPKARETLVGSGSGLVMYTWERADGLRMDGGGTADCRPTDVAQGQQLVFPFTKSGGFDAEAPNAQFWKEYFRERLQRMNADEN